MTFWIAALLLTVCATGLVVLPLLRSARVPDVPAAHDLSVYRDQLQEVSRDVAGGSLNGDEAEAARAEIGRRLLRAAEEEKRSEADQNAVRSRSKGLLFIAIALFIPVAGLAGYLDLGSPSAPSMPLSAREAGPDGNPDLASLVSKAEAHLRANPDDGRGWDVLAPVYMRTGRIQDAVIAYGNAIRLMGATASRESGLGEALVMQNQGQVVQEAADAFHRALELQPDDPKAQFFLAVGLAQAGEKDQALAAFDRLKQASPADAPWLPAVDSQIAALGGAAGQGAAQSKPDAGAPPGNPTREQMAAAGQMSSEDRMSMIRGMVGRLDQQLKENADNLAGWKRLVRSYMVLGDKAKAEASLKRALEVFPAGSDGGRELIALAGDLGMRTETGQ